MNKTKRRTMKRTKRRLTKRRKGGSNCGCNNVKTSVKVKQA